ncbi:MAG: DUF5752 family protein [Candidatus Binatia bacterium]
MDAFQFFTKLDQTLLLGVRAKTIEELLNGIRTIPDSSIYFHTHHFLQQHHFLSPEPPNDFAYWVTEVLGDDILGEQLWSVDIVQFNLISDLRARFMSILENALAESSRRIESPKGEEFYFMAARTFVLPTGYIARNLNEFSEHLAKVSVNSIYFHMFDAKLRLKTGENDFSRWLRDLGKTALADAIKRLDPYSYTLDGLRQQIRDLAKRYGTD